MHKHERILIEKKLSFLKLLQANITASSDFVVYSYRTMQGTDIGLFLHDLSQSLIGSKMLIQAEVSKLEKLLLEPEKIDAA